MANLLVLPKEASAEKFEQTAEKERMKLAPQ